jgi:hypothetical protein
VKKRGWECSDNVITKEVGTTTGVGEDLGKKEPSYTVGGNVN